jgi:hypothetical protein
VTAAALAPSVPVPVTVTITVTAPGQWHWHWTDDLRVHGSSHGTKEGLVLTRDSDCTQSSHGHGPSHFRVRRVTSQSRSVRAIGPGGALRPEIGLGELSISSPVTRTIPRRAPRRGRH